MIQRITRIDNYGIFQKWRWPSNEVAFKRTSLTYGANGTGKSTLAAALADAASGVAAGSGILLDVLSSNSAATTNPVDVYDRTNSLWRRLFVFDRRYVEENLAFDGDPVSARHLLTLGKAAVDAAETVRKNRLRMEEIEADIPTLEKEEKGSKRERDRLATDTAKQISEECQAAAPRFHPRSYKAPSVRALLDNNRDALESAASTNVSMDLGTINEHVMPELSEPPWPTPDLPRLEEDVRRLLDRSVASVAIDELKYDPRASAWVQAGLELHDGRSKCLFCDSEVSEGRRGVLAAHFDKAMTDLQHQLKAVNHALVDYDEGLSRAFNELPRAETVTVVQRERYETWLSGTAANTQKIKGHIAALMEAIERKQDQIFEPVPMPSLPDYAPIDLAEMSDILASHNKLTKSSQEAKEQAALRVERRRVRDIAKGYDELAQAEDEARVKRETLLTERRTLVEAINELERTDRDPAPLARELTEELQRLLGRGDLAIAPIDGTDRYEITRNGKPATKLSEGEQTAISLLYFLASLRQEDGGVSENEKIVVVDDPVSSLDSNIMLGASVRLWHRLHDEPTVRQVILLTHNFELLRTWMQLLHRDGKKTIAELRVRSVLENGNHRRVPHLVEWPKDDGMRKRLRSEYHYLFWRVGTTLSACREPSPPFEAEMDAVSVLPNAARKMLEAFFSFREPAHIGNLAHAVEECADEASDTDVGVVTRYLHQQSHNEQVDIGRGVNITNALETLSSVFAVMKAVDKKHVQEMCNALNLEFDSL